jgi:CheY-like chemotaxis protein
VLVVEDNADTADIIQRRLQLDGMEPVVCMRGAEAKTLLGQRQFDAVVLDIMMPDVSGFEVLEHVRATPALADLPVIMLTAKAGPQDREQARTWAPTPTRQTVRPSRPRPYAARLLPAALERRGGVPELIGGRRRPVPPPGSRRRRAEPRRGGRPSPRPRRARARRRAGAAARSYVLSRRCSLVGRDRAGGDRAARARDRRAALIAARDLSRIRSCSATARVDPGAPLAFLLEASSRAWRSRSIISRRASASCLRVRTSIDSRDGASHKEIP